MAHHTVTRCSCGTTLTPCVCGDLLSSDFDPHEIDMRDGACDRCVADPSRVVKTTPLDAPLPSRFGAAHAHDLDNVVDMDRSSNR